jgi:hypothetical protein
MALHVTVILRTTLDQAQKHIDDHFPGAVTKQAGRFLAIQHPDFDRMGVMGVKAICVARNLPTRNVCRKEPLDG